MYKILIVEDEEIIRKGITFMMDWQKLGCIVADKAANGKEGLEKIRKHKPDIVISDIRMPIMNGLEMLKEALATESFHAVLLSGYDEFEYAREGIRLGVEEYLLKPVNFDELASCILRIKEKLKENIKPVMDASSVLDSGAFQHSIKSRHIRALITDVQENYAKKLTLQELGEKYELTPSYLNSKFKSETGYTFNDFLTRYRIVKALELLQNEPQLKIYEIAEKVGYTNYKYFSNVFKKYVGYAPLQMYNHFDE